MSNPKPRIRPKADPDPQQSDRPLRDSPLYPERDPPVFTELDPGMERRAGERLIFHEDDCLR